MQFPYVHPTLTLVLLVVFWPHKQWKENQFILPIKWAKRQGSLSGFLVILAYAFNRLWVQVNGCLKWNTKHLIKLELRNSFCACFTKFLWCGFKKSNREFHITGKPHYERTPCSKIPTRIRVLSNLETSWVYKKQLFKSNTWYNWSPVVGQPFHFRCN